MRSLSAHYEDLKAAQAHLTNSYSQQQATITRLREDLDRVRGLGWESLVCALVHGDHGVPRCALAMSECITSVQ